MTARTRVFALLGDPVAHSLSPAMQNAAFRAAGRDAVYVALRCDAADVPPLIRTLALAGGGNVTTPHKRAAAAALDGRRPAVERTGGCNTFWLEDGRVVGDNTDVAGFGSAVHALVGDAAGARVLLIGAGGAAAAAACALLDGGVAAIDVLNRSPDRAAALARSIDPGGRLLRTLHRSRGVGEYDLIVNGTTLGLRQDDPLPHPLEGARGAVLDMVYRPGGTAWIRHAQARGLRAADGLEMLLTQGAAAFECWFGEPAPVETMRAALAAAAVPT
jgi:shikimate dehydrogenase